MQTVNWFDIADEGERNTDRARKINPDDVEWGASIVYLNQAYEAGDAGTFNFAAKGIGEEREAHLLSILSDAELIESCKVKVGNTSTDGYRCTDSGKEEALGMRL